MVIITRVEPKITNILSNLGGYGGMLAGILIVVNIFEDVQLSVASSLVADNCNEDKRDKDIPNPADKHTVV